MCKGSQKATTTATSAPDPQAYALYQRLLGRAEDVSNTPYTAYSGDLVSPINAQQQLGIGSINALSPFYNQAMQLSSNIATPLTAAEIQQYQDPFTQSVINTTQNQFSNANEEARQKLLGSAAAQGALGGNRVGVAEGELARQQQMAQAPVIAGLQSQGYNTGLNTALAMKELQSRGVQGMLSAGQGALGVAGAQLGAGTVEQQNQQQLLDALYGQWQQQQAYPFQTTQWLANLGTGVGSNMGGTSSTSTPGPNQTSQLVGGITSGLGMLGSMGFFNRGGRVKGLAAGGVVPDYVIPESEDSLRAQQEQLLRGNRDVQMFPQGTEELPVPLGAERYENDRGAFHFNPEAVGVADVASASAQGRENDLLDLGPYSKADVAEYVKNGSPLLAIIERAPDGTEVRAALGTPETVEAQLQVMEQAKSPENTVTVEDFEKILGDRVNSSEGIASEGPAEGLAAGGSAQQRLGFTPWSAASGVVPTPEFGMVKGSGAPRPPSPYQDREGGPKIGDMSGLGKALKGAFSPKSDVVHTPGGYSEAFPTPDSSGGYRMGGVYVPVFGGAARGGAVEPQSVGLAPDTLQELYGIDSVPGLASGGAPYRIYENEELSPLDPPSGATRDALIRGVIAEAGNQGPRGMQAVANVVRNRAVAGNYGGDTVEGVLNKPYQFEPFNTESGRARMGRIDPNSPQYAAAGEAVDRAYTGDDPTEGATHFYAPKAQAALGRPAPAWDDGSGRDLGDHRFFGGVGSNSVAAGRGVAGDEVSAARVRGYAPRDAVDVETPVPEVPRWKPDVDLSSEGKIWPSLIAAGLGMLASRSPFAGVGIGEGGLAGLHTYAQLKSGEEQKKMARERLNLEAQRLKMSADVEARRAAQAEYPYTRMTLEQMRRLEQDRRKQELEERRQEFLLRKPEKVTDSAGRDHWLIPKPSADGKSLEWWPYDPRTKQLGPNPIGTPNPLLENAPQSNLQGVQPQKPGMQQATMTEVQAIESAPPMEIRGNAAPASKEARNEPYLKYLAEERGGGVDGVKYAQLIKGIADYQINPNSLFSLRGNARQRALEDVMMYDPTYQQQRYEQVRRALAGWTQSPEGRATRSLSVTVEHLMSLEDLSKALNNGDTQAINALRNTFKTQFGYEGPPNFNFAKQIVADEIAKAVIGGQTAQGDREHLQRQISAASSPEQLAGVIKVAKELMAGQLVGLQQMYQTATGLSNFDQYLTPNARDEVGVLMKEREHKLLQRQREREKATGAPTAGGASERDKAAAWISKNPNDPRVPALKKKFGIE